MRQAYLGLAALVLIMAIPLSRFFWRPPLVVRNPLAVKAVIVFAAINLLVGGVVWLGVLLLPRPH